MEPRQELKNSALPNDAIPAEYRANVIGRIKKVLQTGMMPPVLDHLQWSGYPQYAWRTNSIVTNYTTTDNELKVFLLCRASDISITISSDTKFGDEISGLTSEKIVASASRILNFPSEMIPKFVVEQKETTIEGIPVCYGVMRCEFDDTGPLIQPKEWWRRIPFWITKGKMFMNIWTEEYMRASEEDPWKF